MQKLTERGIRLANQLRSLGIPVIESYPGAAQDIMRIPRKRASVDLLAKGLENFGMTGEFTEANVTHDELDAITSAVVGIFFWSGKFEALGNEEEEYLIVPDQKADSSIWKTRKVIGLSGPIAAGKTTAGIFLKYKGFHYARFSEALEKLLLDRSLQPNRQSLQQIGEEVNKIQGQRWLDRKLAQMLPKQGDIVIDGLRFPDDHAFLVETFGPAFIHIHLTSPEMTRLKRYLLSQGDERDFREAISHPVEANVNKLRSLAHIILDNSTSIKSFEKRIINAVMKKEDWEGKNTLCP
jgi:dephospho-CoA kinase